MKEKPYHKKHPDDYHTQKDHNKDTCDNRIHWLNLLIDKKPSVCLKGACCAVEDIFEHIKSNKARCHKHRIVIACNRMSCLLSNKDMNTYKDKRLKEGFKKSPKKSRFSDRDTHIKLSKKERSKY